MTNFQVAQQDLDILCLDEVAFGIYFFFKWLTVRWVNMLVANLCYISFRCVIDILGLLWNAKVITVSTRVVDWPIASAVLI